MQAFAVALLSLLVVACASAPVAPVDPALFHDRHFGAASERISADDVFAVSPAMKRYLETEIAAHMRARGTHQALVEALYNVGQLKLEYDTETTRNASEAFDARAGNCLSLVIMTAAFANELGLTVRFQSVYTDEIWSRDGDIYLSIGHVNLTLGRKPADLGFGFNVADPLTIDFLPPRNLRGLRTRDIGPQTIVAMYMNNRAVESLTQGRLDNAYRWAREAIVQDPAFLVSYNTLGAIYQRHGNRAEAEQVYAYALAREPDNTHVMSNLSAILDEQGRTAEAGALATRLRKLDPNPPFSYFNQGMAALRKGDYRAARDLFAKEVDRASYYHEFQFWLAVAYAGLGDVEHARDHLVLAMENSTTRKDHDLYAAKLDKVNALSPR